MERRKRRSRRPAQGELHVDGVLARVAARQRGNLTRSQLLEAGLSADAIDHWVRRGRLHCQFRGVYALAHLALPPLSREMAAVLACGDNALLSHASAAYIWGFRPPPPVRLVDVTMVARHVRRRSGIRVHYAALREQDKRMKSGIPITSPARTLIDIAPDLDARELELALHEAIATRKVSISQVRAALATYPRRRGTARLTTLVARHGPLTLTQKGAEEKLFRLLRKSGLPTPLTNHRLGRWNLDFYWPEYRLAVEVDGLDFHSTLPNVERDHRKDVDLRRRAVDVMRFTGRQVATEPEMALATVAWELGRREALRLARAA